MPLPGPRKQGASAEGRTCSASSLRWARRWCSRACCLAARRSSSSMASPVWQASSSALGQGTRCVCTRHAWRAPPSRWVAPLACGLSLSGMWSRRWSIPDAGATGQAARLRLSAWPADAWCACAAASAAARRCASPACLSCSAAAAALRLARLSWALLSMAALTCTAAPLQDGHHGNVVLVLGWGDRPVPCWVCRQSAQLDPPPP